MTAGRSGHDEESPSAANSGGAGSSGKGRLISERQGDDEYCGSAALGDRFNGEVSPSLETSPMMTDSVGGGEICKEYGQPRRVAIGDLDIRHQSRHIRGREIRIRIHVMDGGSNDELSWETSSIFRRAPDTTGDELRNENGKSPVRNLRQRGAHISEAVVSEEGDARVLVRNKVAQSWSLDGGVKLASGNVVAESARVSEEEEESSSSLAVGVAQKEVEDPTSAPLDHRRRDVSAHDHSPCWKGGQRPRLAEIPEEDEVPRAAADTRIDPATSGGNLQVHPRADRQEFRSGRTAVVVSLHKTGKPQAGYPLSPFSPSSGMTTISTISPPSPHGVQWSVPNSGDSFSPPPFHAGDIHCRQHNFHQSGAAIPFGSLMAVADTAGENPLANGVGGCRRSSFTRGGFNGSSFCSAIPPSQRAAFLASSSGAAENHLLISPAETQLPPLCPPNAEQQSSSGFDERLQLANGSASHYWPRPTVTSHWLPDQSCDAISPAVGLPPPGGADSSTLVPQAASVARTTSGESDLRRDEEGAHGRSQSIVSQQEVPTQRLLPSMEENLLKVRNEFSRRANFFVSRGRLGEAVQTLTEGLAMFPEDGDLLLSKAKCCRDMGMWDEALGLCDRSLSVFPASAEALFLKGQLLSSLGKFLPATHALGAARDINPRDEVTARLLALTLVNLAQELAGNNNLHAAKDRLREALRIHPDCAAAHLRLGTLASLSGEPLSAFKHHAQAAKLDENCLEAWTNLANACRLSGRLGEAAIYFQRAHAINPNSETLSQQVALTLTEFGMQLKAEGQTQEAVNMYKKALALFPSSPHAWYNLGVVHGEAHEMDQAAVCYHLAVTFNPQFAEAHNNLGVLYRIKENLPMALLHYHKALEARPNFAHALNNLGVTFAAVGKLREAYEHTYRAIHANPTDTEAHNNLGVLCRDEGDIDSALVAYEEAIKVDGKASNALQNRLLLLNYFPKIPAGKIYELSLEWGLQVIARLQSLQQSPVPCWLNPPHDRPKNSALRPLRVGYLSPDFFTHSVSYFIHGPLACHNPTEVEVFVYSSVPKEDAKTAQLRSYIRKDHWRVINFLSVQQAAELIRKDGIHILVELSGHTAHNKIEITALRPAPIQVTWVGYPNTTGLPTIDYRLTDALADPLDTTQPHVEELVRLPGCFLCYTPRTPLVPINEPPAASFGFVTFGSFNMLAKVTNEVLDLWCRVLHEVPNSRVLLKAKPFSDSGLGKSWIRAFAARGIEGHRIDLLGLTSSTADHLKTYHLVDIALDAFPYAGTTTTCEALLMGVPVVTLRGRSHAHNVGVSLLTAAGFPELIAANHEEYIGIAKRIATNAVLLSTYRRTIRDKMIQSPLCNGVNFAANLEATYRQLFQRYCQGDSPAERRMMALQEHARLRPTPTLIAARIPPSSAAGVPRYTQQTVLSFLPPSDAPIPSATTAVAGLSVSPLPQQRHPMDGAAISTVSHQSSDREKHSSQLAAAAASIVLPPSISNCIERHVQSQGDLMFGRLAGPSQVGWH